MSLSFLTEMLARQIGIQWNGSWARWLSLHHYEYQTLVWKKNYSLENVLLLYIYLIPTRTWVLNILNILLVGCIIIHLERCFSNLVALVNHLGSFLKMSKLGRTPRDSDLIVLGWGPGKGIFKKHPRCFKCVVKTAAHYWFRGGTVLFKCS